MVQLSLATILTWANIASRWVEQQPWNPLRAFRDTSTIQSSYDFIIVGGGTAGLVLANRLSEIGNQTVLVVEVGTAPSIIKSYEIPAIDGQLWGTQIDWAFATSPQSGLNGRQITYNRGRCLGGSSAINGLAYTRGSSVTYDLWASMGNEGWGWEDVFPYFKKSTRFIPPSEENSRYAGYDPSAYSPDGPLAIAYGNYAHDPAFAFVEAMGDIGIPYNPEMNAGDHVGAKRQTLTSDGSKRASAYDAYYLPVKGRSNLQVVTYGQVQGVLFSEVEIKAATGIALADQISGRPMIVNARKEVIMAAGVFHTPQLLMLSGIGPAEQLNRMGIDVYHANENVGQHLQDHVLFSVVAKAEPSSSLQNIMGNVDGSFEAARVLHAETGGGPLATHSVPSYAWEKLSTAELESLGLTELIRQGRAGQSHVEYIVETFWFPPTPTPQGLSPRKRESYISLTSQAMTPLSIGNVTLRSNQIVEPLMINPAYFTAPEDMQLALRSFKKLRQALASKAFENITVGPDHGEVAPGASVQSDEDLMHYIRATAITNWHACGTCRMLPLDQGGVVDSRLRLHGVQGLRIVDASVFPLIPDTHIVAAVYMVAEKAADMIKEDWRLI